MERVKRVEIVLDQVELPRALKMLEALGVPGYTVIRDVAGFGHRGRRAGDQVTDVLRNAIILIACPPDMVPAIAKTIRPVLKQFGGICLVSDADSLIH